MNIYELNIYNNYDVIKDYTDNLKGKELKNNRKDLYLYTKFILKDKNYNIDLFFNKLISKIKTIDSNNKNILTKYIKKFYSIRYKNIKYYTLDQKLYLSNTNNIIRYKQQLFINTSYTNLESQYIKDLYKKISIKSLLININVFRKFLELYLYNAIKNKKVLTNSNKIDKTEIEIEDVIAYTNLYLIDLYNKLKTLKFNNKKDLLNYSYKFLMYKISKKILKDYNFKYKQVEEYQVEQIVEEEVAEYKKVVGSEYIVNNNLVYKTEKILIKEAVTKLEVVTHNHVLENKNTSKWDEEYDNIGGDFDIIKEYNAKAIRKSIVNFTASLNMVDKHIFLNIINKYYYNCNHYTREELAKMLNDIYTVRQIRYKEEQLKNDFKKLIIQRIM